MGLGKTIQVIAFLAAVLEKQGIEEDLNSELILRKLQNVRNFRYNKTFFEIGKSKLII